MREVDKVIVKGKTKPVDIFEVVDFYSEDDFPNMMDVLNNFGFGIQSYRHGKFDEAEKAFREALRLNPKDFCSQMYIERCEHLKENPPHDWDGVWKLTSK